MIKHTTDIGIRAADIAEKEAKRKWQQRIREDPDDCTFFETIWLQVYHKVLAELQPLHEPCLR